MKSLRFELILWINHFVKFIPGFIGCKIRSIILPITIGRGSKVWDQVHIDSPSKLIIGRNSSINRGVILNAAGGIDIGDDVLIGPNVIIYSQNHIFSDNKKLIRDQGYSIKKVIIENNVWLAAGVIVLPGVTIRENSVVAAGTVVTKDIPAYSLVAGQPARVIRKLA